VVVEMLEMLVVEMPLGTEMEDVVVVVAVVVLEMVGGLMPLQERKTWMQLREMGTVNEVCPLRWPRD